MSDAEQTERDEFAKDMESISGGPEPYPHFCPDWDFLEVRPGDPEMEGCLCFGPSEGGRDGEADAAP